MEFFSLNQYLLIILIILLHAGWGWAFGVRGFFTAALFGTCISGLAVGLLANVCASAIVPWIWLTTLLGGILTLKTAASLALNRDLVFRSATLIACGFLIAFFNNPTVSHFDGGIEGTHVYNAHYGYYANQSSEMLQAQYPERLRVSEFYPKTWARYHFFTSGTYAVVQSLLPSPGMFTYFMAQLVFLVFILLSFLERWWARNQLLGLAVATGWSVLGFYLLPTTLSYNFKTNGVLTTFAIVHLVGALYQTPGQSNRREAFLFALLAGVSAFRMLPVSLGIAGGIALWELRAFGLSRLLPKTFFSCVRDITAGALFLLYNAVTFFSPGTEKAFFTRLIFNDDWLYVLSSYQFIGYFLNPLLRALGNNRFRNFNETQVFSELLPTGNTKSLVFLGGVLAVLFYGAYRWIKSHPTWRQSLSLKFTLSAITLFLGVGLLSANLLSLHLTVLPYLILGSLWVYSIYGYSKNPDYAWAGGILLAGFTLTLLFLYLGSDDITAPVAYSVFDVGLWALFAIWLALGTRARLAQGFTLALVVICALFLNPGIAGILKCEDDRLVWRLPMSKITTIAKKRTDVVGPDNQLNNLFTHPGDRQVVASILGARLPFDNSNQTPISYVYWLR